MGIVLSVQRASGAPAVIDGDMKLIEGRSLIDGYWTCADQKKHRVGRSGWPHGILEQRFLFNLTADPSESTNLFTEMPDVAQRLSKILEAAKASAVEEQPTERDSSASDWQHAHNNTLGPWVHAVAGFTSSIVV